MELINAEINNIIGIVRLKLGKVISREEAFIFLVVQHFYYEGVPLDEILYEVSNIITDGANDGGVDFLFYDEDNQKIILGQTKFTHIFTLSEMISELNKMEKTFIDFSTSNTGTYNTRLKKVFQNSLDRLMDDEDCNIEYAIFSLTKISDEEVERKIDNERRTYSKDNVSVYQETTIHSQIRKSYEKINLVDSAKLKIDNAKNALKYDNGDGVQGILVNVSSRSIVQLYNSYANNGLFDLNIRRYIRSKHVDEGIRKTLRDARNDFWFLNNGITIACKEFEHDGDQVRLEKFSIVNGGQTTYLIGNEKSAGEEFYIPCKIISSSETTSENFYNKIAEATNSQKPIQLRDLRSNSPEMRNLKKFLMEYGIFLEIKRGENKSNKSSKVIKNDVLGQLLLSFINQRPGTARSNKKAIFENTAIYNSIFRVNYIASNEKKLFIVDIIDLDNRCNAIYKTLALSNEITEIEKEILSNGKLIIFSILGILYMITNDHFDVSKIISNPSSVGDFDKKFVYHSIISQYKEDDIDIRLRSLIIRIIINLSESYSRVYSDGSVSSISNYFKLDSRYYFDIVKDFMNAYRTVIAGEEYRRQSIIFNSMTKKEEE